MKTLDFDIHRVSEVDSTNKQLKKLAKAGQIKNGYVLSADRQTAGLARNKQRNWVSDEGGLYTSIFFDHTNLLLPVYASVAIVRGLYDLEMDVKIKWPNDILIDGRKVCGILCEAGMNEKGKPFSICGFGINVKNREFPEEIRDRATSIALERKEEVSKEVTLFSMLHGFNTAFADQNILETYRRDCITLGAKVRLVEEDKIVQAVDIDDNGYLIIDDGGLRKIISGDVSIRGEKGYI